MPPYSFPILPYPNHTAPPHCAKVAQTIHVEEPTYAVPPEARLLAEKPDFERKNHRGRTMRRTISTLMFLAAAGLAYFAHAADQNGGSADYYAAGTSTYRVSDDDDEDAAPVASKPASTVATAVGLPHQSGQEQHALYLADKATLGNELLQT